MAIESFAASILKKVKFENRDLKDLLLCISILELLSGHDVSDYAVLADPWSFSPPPRAARSNKEFFTTM